jgi:hypothetical protein
MSAWSPADWATFLGVLATTATGLYLGVVRPALIQLRELVEALRANTASTNVSAAAMTTTAAAVVDNTVATQQVAQALPPVTVNVTTDAPPEPPAHGRKAKAP